jgi:ribonuclease G
MLVFLPQDKHIGISQRIGDEAEREALRERVTACCRPARPAATSSARWPRTPPTKLAADIAYLKKLWAEIKNRAVGARPPTVLYQDLNLAQRVLRDLVTEDTTRIVADSRENFQKLSAFASEYMPQVRRCSSTTPASARCSTCTASRPRSRRPWPGGSTSNPAAT